MAAQAAARLRDHNESKQQERRTSDAAAPRPSRRLPARRRSDSIPVSTSRQALGSGYQALIRLRCQAVLVGLCTGGAGADDSCAGYGTLNQWLTALPRRAKSHCPS